MNVVSESMFVTLMIMHVLILSLGRGFLLFYTHHFKCF